jgi:hypothetical protein
MHKEIWILRGDYQLHRWMIKKTEEGKQDFVHNTHQANECVCSKLSWNDVILIQVLWVFLYRVINSSYTEVNKFGVTEHAALWYLLVIDTFR